MTSDELIDQASDATTVKVETKSVYGNTLIYPANKTALIFAELVGKKTLSPKDLTNIQKLGFAIKEVTFRQLVAA